MKWTRQETATAAWSDCPRCSGLGHLSNRVICSCVYRHVFRACHRAFRRCVLADPHSRTVSFERTSHAVDRSLTWVRRNEDFCADFQAAGYRALPAHLWPVFRFYHLLGASVSLVARRLGIQESNLRSVIYDVEALVGREIAHVKPYSLYPPYDYLHSGFGQEEAANATDSFPVTCEKIAK